MVGFNQTKSKLQMADEALHRVQVSVGRVGHTWAWRPGLVDLGLSSHTLPTRFLPGACSPALHPAASFSTHAALRLVLPGPLQVELEKTQFELQNKKGECAAQEGELGEAKVAMAELQAERDDLSAQLSITEAELQTAQEGIEQLK